MSNRIVVDLTKVQWASFYYTNQYGDARRTKPKSVTVHGVIVPSLEIHASLKIPMTRAAVEMKLADKWIATLRLKVTANTWLKYTGSKATSIYKEFCRRQFAGKRKD